MQPKILLKQKAKVAAARTPLKRKLSEARNKSLSEGKSRYEIVREQIMMRLKERIPDDVRRSDISLDALDAYIDRYPNWEWKDPKDVARRIAAGVKGNLTRFGMISSSSSMKEEETAEEEQQSLSVQPPSASLLMTHIPAGLSGPASADVSGGFFQPLVGVESQYAQMPEEDAMIAMITSPTPHKEKQVIGTPYAASVLGRNIFQSPQSVATDGWEDASISHISESVSNSLIADNDSVSMVDAAVKNIKTSSGGGGEHAVMPHSGAFDIDFPTYNMIGGALDNYLKPSMHALLLSQTPNVYQSETVHNERITRDRTNPPKRSEMLDAAIWKQPKEPSNAHPHTWWKIGDSYSNPAKIGTISCWDKFVSTDDTRNLTGMFGAPFGTNLDDRWTQGTNPFTRPDRLTQPNGYVDWTKNFLSSYGVS